MKFSEFYYEDEIITEAARIQISRKPEDLEQNKAAIADYIEDHIGIKGKYFVDDDLRVNVEGQVVIHDHFGKFPFKWGVVDGDFHIFENGLQTLDGFPTEVTGVVRLSGLPIKNLKGMGKVGELRITKCAVTSLDGVPSSVKNLYLINLKNLKSLVGLPDVDQHLFIEKCFALENFKVDRKVNVGKFHIAGDNSTAYKSLIGLTNFNIGTLSITSHAFGYHYDDNAKFTKMQELVFCVNSNEKPSKYNFDDLGGFFGKMYREQPSDIVDKYSNLFGSNMSLPDIQDELEEDGIVFE